MLQTELPFWDFIPVVSPAITQATTAARLRLSEISSLNSPRYSLLAEFLSSLKASSTTNWSNVGFIVLEAAFQTKTPLGLVAKCERYCS